MKVQPYPCSPCGNKINPTLLNVEQPQGERLAISRCSSGYLRHYLVKWMGGRMHPKRGRELGEKWAWLFWLLAALPIAKAIIEYFIGR